MKMQVSKAYKGKEHVGFKKTVAGHEWFLIWGTTAAHELVAIRIAIALEAKAQLAKLTGERTLTKADFNEAVAIAEGRVPPRDRCDLPAEAVVQSTVPASSPIAPAEKGDGWLFEGLDQVVAWLKDERKPDGSDSDHILNNIDRINRARDATEDIQLSNFRRRELGRWLQGLKKLINKRDGVSPLQPVTIRNHATAIRFALKKLAAWEFWTPPPLWEEEFEGYTIKKLETPSQRDKRRKKRPRHTVTEKRVLWHVATDFGKAMMALSDWAGHTQKEIATLKFSDFRHTESGLFIDRCRNKTGVRGRWWIPPEAAEVILRVIARTPRDPAVNPQGLAFLTSRGMPLVHRRDGGKRTRSDYVGGNLWRTLLYAAKPYGVRWISFKYARKGMSQRIRNLAGKEVSRTFLAHADEDVQDESYTRASIRKVEHVVRKLYPKLKGMFERIKANDWQSVIETLETEATKRKQRKLALQLTG